jgi:sensor domain CHASE-containing protein
MYSLLNKLAIFLVLNLELFIILNTNKKNYYTENVQLKETINNQKFIIARLEKDINVKIKTIDYLTQQLVCRETVNNEVSNLLDFD